jgi:aryl-alcohol dehydrogenase-like predicted oxidoreductase
MSPQLGKKSLSREYILQAVDASLRRLQISHIDLYQAHIDDPDTPLEETLDTFTQLIKQGKVRAIGASNYTAARLAEALRISEAHGFARYECLQPEYNLYDREDYEAKSQALCAEEEIGVISYFSLARGFLSGKYSCESDLDKSERGSGVKKYLNSRGFAIIDALKAIAADYRSTPAQIALAWLMARPTITAPIASATNLQQLHDLVESTKLALSPSAIAALDHASAYLPSPAGS